MSSNDYHFVTPWRVKGTIAEVDEILRDFSGFPRWWSSVYLRVELVEPGDADGIGRLLRLHTKGKLPYTLTWQARVVERHSPFGFTIEASGDFEGRGIWAFEQDSEWVNATFDWKLRAEKPLLRWLSFLLKPLFSANHRWAMARGEEGLERELARLHAREESMPAPQRAGVSPPRAVVDGSTSTSRRSS